jgi:hypothetical protein
MRHGLRYQGGFERNYAALEPGAKRFQGSDGAEHPLPEWPAEVDGLRVGYMEKPGKRFVAVRVQDDAADVVLRHEVLLDPSSHLGHGKRFSPEPTVIADEVARVLLDDIIARNAEQRGELAAIRARMPWARRPGG